MSKRDACLAIIIAAALDSSNTRRKKRRWSKECFLKRQKCSHNIPVTGMKLADPFDYLNTFRMDASSFEELLKMVSPLIEKKDTIMRLSIPASQRLAATLRFLATGQSFEDLKSPTAIAPQTLSKIVMETCLAIIQVLKNNIKLPNSEQEWKNIALEFFNKWNFPNCLGVLDGKHVQITKPPGSGYHFYNYNRTFSIVLMALVNSEGEFTMVDVGVNGRGSDGGAVSKTKFWSQFQQKELHIPDPDYLPGSSKKAPFVFVGNEAFPFQNNLMIPYIPRDLDKGRLVFNDRLSKVQKVVENTFGILSSRFRILLTTVKLSPDKVSNVVLTCCHLHNYLKQHSDSEYILNGSNSEIDLLQLRPTRMENASATTKEIRDLYCHYFNCNDHCDELPDSGIEETKVKTENVVNENYKKKRFMNGSGKTEYVKLERDIKIEEDINDEDFDAEDHLLEDTVDENVNIKEEDVYADVGICEDDSLT